MRVTLGVGDEAGDAGPTNLAGSCHRTNRTGISDENRFRHDKQYFLSLPEREHSDRHRFALLAVVFQAYGTGTAGYDAARRSGAPPFRVDGAYSSSHGQETVRLALTTNFGFLVVLGEPRWFASFV